MLLAVTILHWDVFNHDHVSFWAWLLLYVATPVLLPVLWATNRRTDPRRLAEGDVRVPARVRVVGRHRRRRPTVAGGCHPRGP